MKKALAPLLLLFAISLAWIIVFLIQSKKDFISTPLENVSFSKEMALGQKIGQMFMIGIEGKSLTEETEKIIKELQPGAILLLGKNIGTEKELKELTADLQRISMKYAGLPLFIAIDQEGGEVSRINWIEKTPQSEIKTEEQAYDVGKKRGEDLKKLGINLNLAPLLDKVSESDFIYERSFTEDIGILGNKIVQGQKDAGILSCVKHFPGYGGIEFHPEDNLARIKDVPEFDQFKEVESPEMIMVSNVIYEELDENEPFSFSGEGLNLLKKNIPGNYLVISDDLSQYSLLNNFSLEEIISGPIEAGADMLIFSGWRSPVREAVSQAVRSSKEGKISEEEINNSVRKIIELKRKHFNL